MRKVLLCAIVSLLFLASGLYAQNPPVPEKAAPAEVVTEKVKDKVAETPAADPKAQIPAAATPEPPTQTVEVKAEKVSDKPKSSQPAPVPVKPAQHAVTQPAAAPSPVVADTVVGLSTIEINEGDFRYFRIKGLSFVKKEAATAKSSDTISMPKIGKSGEWTESVMMWIVVLSIIVLIILLYRYGKKRRRGRVFRRFP